MRPGFLVKALTLLVFFSLIGVFIAYRMGVFSDANDGGKRFDTVMKDSVYDAPPTADDMMPSTKSSDVIDPEKTVEFDWGKASETESTKEEVEKLEFEMLSSSKTVALPLSTQLTWFIDHDSTTKISIKPDSAFAQPQKKK